MRFKSLAAAILILAGSFFISLEVMDWIWPPRASKPTLVKLPPLPSATRKSEFVAPITIPLSVIASALDRAAPPSSEELDQLCLDNIARYKRPKEYRFVDSLPTSNYGKVLKRELRAQLMANA